MNWYCILKAIAPYMDGTNCDRYQCQMCKDYQAGLTKPAYPMPAIPTFFYWTWPDGRAMSFDGIMIEHPVKSISM